MWFLVVILFCKTVGGEAQNKEVSTVGVSEKGVEVAREEGSVEKRGKEKD